MSPWYFAQLSLHGPPFVAFGDVDPYTLFLTVDSYSDSNGYSYNMSETVCHVSTAQTKMNKMQCLLCFNNFVPLQASQLH